MKISDRGSEILVDTSAYAPVGYDGDYMDWRIRAACADTPNHDIFISSTQRWTRSHFAEALSYCDRCSVQTECLDDAMKFGDHLVSVRGGLIPAQAEHPAKRAYNPMEPFGEDMWEMYCQNAPTAVLREASGVGSGTHNALMTRMLNERLTGPETASWVAHVSPTDRVIPANIGWPISASEDGRLYCLVIKNSRGQRYRHVRAREYITFSDDAVTEGLPILVHLPEAYQD